MLQSPTSFYNQRLPASVAIDSNSEAYVANLKEAGEANSYGFNYRNWAKTIFFASSADPKVAFTIDQPHPLNPYFKQMGEMLSEVPMPPTARPPGPWEAQGDNHMCIVCHNDDETYSLYEFWRARDFEVDGIALATQESVDKSVLETPGWHCQSAMAVKNVRANPGYFDANSWPGIEASRKYSAAASGLTELGGVITVAEAERRHIPHALTFTGIHSAITASPNYRWPAQKTDGASKAEFAVQEGMIFTVEKSTPIESLFSDSFIRACAQAICDYGMVINDGSSDTIAINCENVATVPSSQETVDDPWKGTKNEFGGPGAIFSKFVGGEGGLAEELFTKLYPYMHVVDASYRPSEFVAGAWLGAPS